MQGNGERSTSIIHSVAEAEAVASAAGATALWLTPWVGNHRALAFCARRGYHDGGLTYFTFEGESDENRCSQRCFDDPMQRPSRMDPEQLKQTFDQQAASYDQKWARLAALRDALHILIGAVFAELPAGARVLCVGAGTGAEMIYLADRFPGWTFTAVEPSAGMLRECRRRADQAGISARCSFHEGYLESLPPTEAFDAATCLLVSQFMLDDSARSAFFRSIAQRLRPGGLLASSDLSADVHSAGYQGLVDVWLRTIAGAGVSPEGIEQMCAAYRRDVAVRPPHDVQTIIMSGGFASSVPFFQAGLMRAWYSRRAP